jgi:hypothetical protein
MGGVPLVIIKNKVVELELITGCRLDLPEQERAEWIALHQAVEEALDLLRFPSVSAIVPPGLYIPLRLFTPSLLRLLSSEICDPTVPKPEQVHHSKPIADTRES